MFIGIGRSQYEAMSKTQVSPYDQKFIGFDETMKNTTEKKITLREAVGQGVAGHQ